MKRGRGNSEIKSNQQPHVIIFRQIVSQVKKISVLTKFSQKKDCKCKIDSIHQWFHVFFFKF